MCVWDMIEESNGMMDRIERSIKMNNRANQINNRANQMKLIAEQEERVYAIEDSLDELEEGEKKKRYEKRRDVAVKKLETLEAQLKELD
jgi:hypothetical protein